ncbi:hypothetical protein C8R44DRAFT_807750 [Mycena epipterygia]|nr:hypothetical protein C8R44DRAFT_807750 [Mycena epipterygia]
MVGSNVALVRVMTMYSKNGGKAGTHAWTPTCDSIGALAFMVVRVFELEFRRRFKIIPKHASALGTVCFAHLPANSFLALLPKEEPVKIFQNHLEIGPRAHIMFRDCRGDSAACKGCRKPEHGAKEGKGKYPYYGASGG